MSKTIFKVGDRVYDIIFGWGEVSKIENDDYPIVVLFGDVHRSYTLDGRYWDSDNKPPTLSFKKYDIVNGGFSQERPKPKLEVGKSYRCRITGTVVINRKGYEVNYGFDPDGRWSNILFCSVLWGWQEIPESEAVELLKKECVRRYGEDWENAKVKSLIGHSSNNLGTNNTCVTLDVICNRNGILFHEGTWAEKLEQPELREGQMIWVTDTEKKIYHYSPFKKFQDGFPITSGKENLLWHSYSSLNPYPDSIEARAIELLRRFIFDEHMGEIFDVGREFLDEIDKNP